LRQVGQKKTQPIPFPEARFSQGAGESVGLSPQLVILHPSSEEKNGGLIREMFRGLVQDLGQKKLRVGNSLGDVRIIKF